MITLSMTVAWNLVAALSSLVYGLFPPRVNWRRCETDYAPPSTAEVKNAWSCSPFPRMPT